MYQEQLQNWLRDFILKLNLCPFAHQPFQAQRIRFSVCEETEEQQLVQHLLKELVLLSENAKDQVETTLIGIPKQLLQFDDFWSFMEWTDELLIEGKLQNVFQLIGFHPDYIFANEAPDDHAHFTNRAPFPVIHILRQDSVEEASAQHPDIKQIPSDNMATLRQISRQQLEQLAYQQ